MLAVRINGVEQIGDDIEFSWIAQQIGRRREAGQVVCVEVRIQYPEVELRLSTPGCAGGAGNPRPLTREELRLVDSWRKFGLDRDDFLVKSLVEYIRMLMPVSC